MAKRGWKAVEGEVTTVRRRPTGYEAMITISLEEEAGYQTISYDTCFLAMDLWNLKIMIPYMHSRLCVKFSAIPGTL